MSVFLDEETIENDPQHLDLLDQVAAALLELIPNYTSVDIQPAVSRAEDGEVIIGAEHAGAVSVEFGTRFRHASAPIRRAGEALGLKVPN